MNCLIFTLKTLNHLRPDLQIGQLITVTTSEKDAVNRNQCNLYKSNGFYGTAVVEMGCIAQVVIVHVVSKMNKTAQSKLKWIFRELSNSSHYKQYIIFSTLIISYNDAEYTTFSKETVKPTTSIYSVDKQDYEYYNDILQNLNETQIFLYIKEI